MPLGLKAQGLLSESQSMGDGWIGDSRRRFSKSYLWGKSSYLFRFPPSLTGSFDSGGRIAERRRDWLSSGMGMRDSHSSTRPAVPRGPQVDRLMVVFLVEVASMRTFSWWKWRCRCLVNDASCGNFPSKTSQNAHFLIKHPLSNLISKLDAMSKSGLYLRVISEDWSNGGKRVGVFPWSVMVFRVKVWMYLFR